PPICKRSIASCTLLLLRGRANDAPASWTAPDFASSDPRAADHSVVAEEDQAGEQLLDRLGPLAPHGDERRGPKVQSEKVCRFVTLEAAGYLAQRESARTAEGRQIPQLDWSQ